MDIHKEAQDYCKEQIERATVALQHFTQTGGMIYDSLLALCVKDHDSYPYDLPWIKKSKVEQLYAWEQEDFWQLDGDCDLEVKHGNELPKIYGAGRSGGYLQFRDTKAWAYVLDAFRGCDILCAASEYDIYIDLDEIADKTDDDYFDEQKEELYHALREIADFFEDAVIWVDHYKACMRRRVKNMQGKHAEYLEGLIENDHVDLFDYSNCVISIEDGRIEVSWPEYARTFADRGSWELCAPEDEGAMRHRVDWRKGPAYSKVFTWKKFVESTEPHIISFHPTSIDVLVDLLQPKVAAARLALRSA